MSRRSAMTVEERFWAKVDKNGPVPTQRPDLGACWLWTGCKIRRGYGHRVDIEQYGPGGVRSTERG